MDFRRKSLRWVRYTVQTWFVLFCIFIGYRFYLFVLHFETGGSPFVERPPSVDAFLPIAGLISFKNFVSTGIVEPFHPAAFVMFSAIISVSLLLKKGFCGWICPVGTISQWLWMTGGKFMGRNRKIWRYLDIPLRSSKYILMAFFLYVVVFRTSPASMAAFLASDYYKVADAKTMRFFTEMSGITFGFLIAVGGLSLVYRNFWCRYLCPYGALLGLLSVVSPFKIKRDEDKCVHCHACNENCPSLINVENKEVVSSPECFGCLTCVSRCPSKGALDISVGAVKRKIVHPVLYPLILLAVFYLIIGAAAVSGNWGSHIPYGEYTRIFSTSLESLVHP
jgi:polyferredoxin